MARTPPGAGEWQKGVSFGSAGRLGAHAAGFEPAENGYLTYQSCGPLFMLIRSDRPVIGGLQLPPRYSVEERTHSWTLRAARYRAAAQPSCQGRPKRPPCPPLDLTVLQSVLSPAVTFASDSDTSFRWRWQVRGSPQWAAFPTAEGVRVAHYSRGYPLRGFDPSAAQFFEAGPRGSRSEPPAGKLAWNGPWLLTFDSYRSRNLPMLWVFHAARPEQIEVTTYEYMDFHFSRPFRRISLMPFYGSAETDREELAGFRKGDGLAHLRAWGDYWAKALSGLPDEIEEHFRIDEPRGTVEVRDAGSRLDGKRPTVCPIPPFLAAATATRYPVRIASRPLPRPRGCRELYTHYGPYRLVRGGELRYTMPLCPYLDTVLSPVRVSGDGRAAALTRRLRRYFDDPKYTYGGDGTYDPDSLLDILHNLRVLAWAAWALRPGQRPAARAAIVRNFAKLFRPGSYLYYREPVTGRRFARDPKIFDWCGNVTYDMDWYSGMNLAGLFAGVYFGALGAGAVRRQWRLVRDIEAYFEIFQDWATMVPWTDMRGEVLNVDCCRHGIQGMIGFARLAERFGFRRQRDLAACIASRYMVYLAAEHALPDLYATGRVPVRLWGRGAGSMSLGFGGLYERDDEPSQVTSAVRNPYTLSPLNPEHMLFLRDYGPLAKLQRYEAEVLDKEVPGWDTRPRRTYFAGRPKGNIERNLGGYHFYMLDPHLFLRMLALDWPSRKALGKVRELSGQVIATALVADAPKVLCPAGVVFEGTEWDAAGRVLTIRARAEQPARAGTRRATWQVLWPEPPARIEGPQGAAHNFRKGRLILTAPARGQITWRLHYAR